MCISNINLAFFYVVYLMFLQAKALQFHSSQLFFLFWSEGTGKCAQRLVDFEKHPGVRAVRAVILVNWKMIVIFFFSELLVVIQ